MRAMWPNKTTDRRALTLIEALAVVVLIGIVTAAVGVGLGQRSADAELRSFAARCNELDARARLLAPTIGKGVLRLEVDAERGIVMVRHEREPILVLEVPHGVRLALLVGEIEHTFVVIDRAGRSPDYELRLGVADQSHRWRIHGLTGAWQRMEDVP